MSAAPTAGSSPCLVSWAPVPLPWQSPAQPQLHAWQLLQGGFLQPHSSPGATWCGASVGGQQGRQGPLAAGPMGQCREAAVPAGRAAQAWWLLGSLGLADLCFVMSRKRQSQVLQGHPEQGLTWPWCSGATRCGEMRGLSPRGRAGLRRGAEHPI